MTMVCTATTTTDPEQHRLQMLDMFHHPRSLKYATARQSSTHSLPETVCSEDDEDDESDLGVVSVNSSADACPDNNVDNKNNERPERKSVQWGTIHIREYNRVVGDHPSVTRGPPLALDWAHAEQDQVLTVAQHQEQDKKRRFWRLCATERTVLLLHEFEQKPAQLEAATRQAELTRLQRAESRKEDEERHSDGLSNVVSNYIRKKNQQRRQKVLANANQPKKNKKTTKSPLRRISGFLSQMIGSRR
eukprot:CAMPEP_0168786982 /NCGR_PEP_ID=MMETSP0725-20121227/11561_1 /TAXON_ID=265536 /ORGANISM="Amphiprora sp., Strain CCMP467" /LENGTH=246 /DNA_ID=CAMNT_0008837165 /DNA_START=93 /DNA_END=833 /DNA_ORIENTATION=+